MRQYILASHGRFAQGIYESVKIIIGEQDHVHIVCGYINGETDVKEKIDEVMKQIPMEDEVIACSDLLGGSVNNELMKYQDRKHFYLIAGMNLPLLMNLFLYKEEHPKELIHRVMPELKNSIVYCNDKLDSMDEDDF